MASMDGELAGPGHFLIGGGNTFSLPRIFRLFQTYIHIPSKHHFPDAIDYAKPVSSKT
jgi:hypothetical protein